MTENEQREEVVREARSWLDTPYHHAARTKGVGVDCAYLLLKVYEAVGIAPPFDPGPYKPGLAMYLKGERLYRKVLSSLAQPVNREPLPGDIQVFRIRVGNATHNVVATHGGIVTDWPKFVHADAVQHAVSEDNALRLPAHATLAQLWTPKAWVM